MKRALLKIVEHSAAFERATRSQADCILCVQPSSSKDGETLQEPS